MIDAGHESARPDSGELARLAADVALRALASQAGVLDELRARAGTVLTASSIVASFMGSEAIRRGGFHAIALLALIAFGVSIVASIWVLLPKPGLYFSLRGPGVYEDVYEFADDMRRTAGSPTGFRSFTTATRPSSTTSSSRSEWRRGPLCFRLYSGGGSFGADAMADDKPSSPPPPPPNIALPETRTGGSWPTKLPPGRERK
jgi:hypothetical protein